MIFGSGIKGKGGVILVYESESLTQGMSLSHTMFDPRNVLLHACSKMYIFGEEKCPLHQEIFSQWKLASECQICAGWTFQGCLENARSQPCADGKGYDMGAMWECPFFVNLQERGSSPSWLLCVSPYPHHCTDRPTNPCLYWLGDYKGGKFQMDTASGSRPYCTALLTLPDRKPHRSLAPAHVEEQVTVKHEHLSDRALLAPADLSMAQCCCQM